MLVAQRLLSKAAMRHIALRILANGCRQNAVTIVDQGGDAVHATTGVFTR